MVDSIESLIIPRPPKQREITTIEEASVSLKEVQKWGVAMARFSDDLYNVLHSGQLVRSWRIENLEAGKIGAGTITTNQLFLGSENFVFDGVLKQVRVYDNQNPRVLRVQWGEFGSGSDAGYKVWDASGTLVFQAASTTFINGAVITNATISNAKITDIDGNKIFDDSVGNSKISSLNAGKITAGTLIVDGSPAIQVTSAGACVFTAGGDIIMRASSTGDNNFISWRTSGNAERATATYNAAANVFSFQTFGGAVFQLIGASTLRLSSPNIILGLGGTQDLTVTARLASSLLLDSHNTRSIGSAGTKLANIHSVNTNFGDIGMENGYRMTEANKVWSWKKPEDGWVLMSDLWQPLLYIDRLGNATFAGRVTYGKLPAPDVERMEDQGETNADGKTLN